MFMRISATLKQSAEAGPKQRDHLCREHVPIVAVAE
jgi:hypothetical protein